MTDAIANAARRLAQVKDLITGQVQDPTAIPWNPNNTSFPSRKDLSRSPGIPESAAWVWGDNDFKGRLNLLTPTRVLAAASQIKTGETARVDLPLTIPAHPAFGRDEFTQKIKPLTPGLSYDDTYTMNTQSGTQWDGFRHVAHRATRLFYNNTKSTDFDNEDGTDNERCSIHHWSVNGGFTGRGILLDYRSYADSIGLRYDSCTRHEISLSDLQACGKHQGIDIRPNSQGGDIQIGDILMIRAGWVRDYHDRTPQENQTIGTRKGREIRFAGLQQSQEMLDWLHDCYFAAVSGDAPAFEAWPPPREFSLHEHLLALWGVPIGEMLDLERASELARKNKRWTFFFSSAPANCPGGVGSHVNGTVVF